MIKIMKELLASGKYEPASSSYQSAILAVEKKGGLLRIIHNLQHLNAVTIWDAMLPPQVEDMIESFSGRAVYGLSNLKAGYDAQILVPVSQDLTCFFVDGVGML